MGKVWHNAKECNVSCFMFKSFGDHFSIFQTCLRSSLSKVLFSSDLVSAVLFHYVLITGIIFKFQYESENTLNFLLSRLLCPILNSVLFTLLKLELQSVQYHEYSVATLYSRAVTRSRVYLPGSCSCSTVSVWCQFYFILIFVLCQCSNTCMYFVSGSMYYFQADMSLILLWMQHDILQNCTSWGEHNICKMLCFFSCGLTCIQSVV